MGMIRLKKLVIYLLLLAAAAAAVLTLVFSDARGGEPGKLEIIVESEGPDGVLVNATHRWEGEPPELVSVFEHKTDSYYVRDKTVTVAKEVMQPLNDMMDAFFAETGLKRVNVVSGYRSEAEQAKLFNEEVAEKGEKEAEKWVNRPGYSEHHTGLAVDLALFFAEDGSSARFDGEGEYAWFRENAWRYGFILRYTEEKQPITGIAPEPWHFRYVGPDAAKLIYEQDLCLEEYLAGLAEK